MNLVAAVAASALAAGLALGAGAQEWRWSARYSDLQADYATRLAAGYAAAVRVQRETEARALSVRSQPVRRVRFCPDDGAGVPAARTGAGLGDLPGGGSGRDYGPALRELLAAAIANRELAHVPPESP